jgi:hypothetical protein
VGIATVLATGGVITTVAGAGCSGGSSSGGSGSGGGGDTCTSAGVQCTVQPAAPSGGTPTSAKHNYAVHTLYLGDTDRTGVTNSDAWKSYGYNLDNLVTAKTSTDVCTLAAGASKTTQVDGNGGIDNSFGENILPIIITTAGSDAAQRINNSINTGSFTLMTYITGFDDSAGNHSSATGLTGVLLAGGNYANHNDGGVPSWDTNTHWPILPVLINGCDPTNGCPAGTDPVAGAQITFPQAYQANGTFVNGTPGNLDLNLSIGGETIDVKVHSALITFDPKAPGSVTNGTIAGVLVSQELVNSLQQVAGRISTSLCSGSAFQSIAQQILQASDIIIDPGSGAVSNTAGANCNGISIGLGFEATEIAAPTAADIVPPQAPSPDPCADAGGGGG